MTSEMHFQFWSMKQLFIQFYFTIIFSLFILLSAPKFMNSFSTLHLKCILSCSQCSGQLCVTLVDPFFLVLCNGIGTFHLADLSVDRNIRWIDKLAMRGKQINSLELKRLVNRMVILKRKFCHVDNNFPWVPHVLRPNDVLNLDAMSIQRLIMELEVKCFQTILADALNQYAAEFIISHTEFHNAMTYFNYWLMTATSKSIFDKLNCDKTDKWQSASLKIKTVHCNILLPGEY